LILRRTGSHFAGSSAAAAPARRALTWWFGLMALGGLAFGLFSERRPFGDTFLAHPLAVFFVIVGAALLALRVALRRPVPEILPERILVFGCLLGVVMFLAGNWIDTHVLSARW
jgi:hypothetical protein